MSKPFELVFLERENDLNKILRFQKKNPTTFKILFISLWDKYCSDLITSLKQKHNSSSPIMMSEGGTTIPVYIVNSFTMPHSTVIFKSNKLPQLVSFNKKDLLVEDYPVMIEKRLRCEF